MRAAVLAVVSVISLAACSPGGGSSAGGSNAAPAAAAPASGGFPTGEGVAYRLEGTMTMGGQTVQQVRYQDGGKMRMEMNAGPMGDTIMVSNMDTHEGFTIAHMAGRTIATRMDLTQPGHTMTQDQLTQMRNEMKDRAHQIGTCSAAGETGTEWDISGATPGAPADTSGAASQPRSICFTHDGIPLQMKINGAVVFNTTKITRGPQDPSLFVAPAGTHFTTMQAPSQAQMDAIVARARAAAASHGTP